jgi:hypothetical protein
MKNVFNNANAGVMACHSFLTSVPAPTMIPGTVPW